MGEVASTAGKARWNRLLMGNRLHVVQGLAHPCAVTASLPHLTDRPLVWFGSLAGRNAAFGPKGRRTGGTQDPFVMRNCSTSEELACPVSFLGTDDPFANVAAVPQGRAARGGPAIGSARMDDAEQLTVGGAVFFGTSTSHTGSQRTRIRGRRALRHRSC